MNQLVDPLGWPEEKLGPTRDWLASDHMLVVGEANASPSNGRVCCRVVEGLVGREDCEQRGCPPHRTKPREVRFVPHAVLLESSTTDRPRKSVPPQIRFLPRTPSEAQRKAWPSRAPDRKTPFARR